MARCEHCKKFMLFSTSTGNCKECDIRMALEAAEAERQQRIAIEKQLEQERQRHKAESDHLHKIEEDYKNAEAKRQCKVDEERPTSEERQYKVDEDKQEGKATLVFSFANWDMAFGNLVFLEETKHILQAHDGEEVIQIGNQYVLKNMFPFTTISEFAVIPKGYPSLSIEQLQSNQNLLKKMVTEIRSQLAYIPYSFQTLAIIYDGTLGLAMVSLSQIEQWSFTLKSQIVYPSHDAARALFDLLVADNRIYNSGYLDYSHETQVYLLSLDQIEQYISKTVSFRTRSQIPKIDRDAAIEYFSQLRGYSDTDVFYNLAEKYENACTEMMASYDIDKRLALEERIDYQHKSEEQSQKIYTDQLKESSVHIKSYSERNTTLFPKFKAGDIISFGQYPFSEDGREQKKIEWFVLKVTNEKIILLSRYILDYLPFTTFTGPRADMKQYLDLYGAYSYVWHNSTIREWLNNDFIERAFSPMEAQAIIIETLSFPEYSETWEDDEFGVSSTFTAQQLEDAHDKVYLASNEDLEQFCSLEVSLPEQAITPYAQCKVGNDVFRSSMQSWWLRTQTISPEYNRALFSDQYMGPALNETLPFRDDDATWPAGIRPMISLDLKKCSDIWSNMPENY